MTAAAGWGGSAGGVCRGARRGVGSARGLLSMPPSELAPADENHSVGVHLAQPEQ